MSLRQNILATKYSVTPVLILLSHFSDLCCLFCLHHCKKRDSDDGNEGNMPRNMPGNLNLDDIQDHSSKEFNARSFFMALSWGVYAALYLVFAIAAFYLVPPSTLHLTEYIETFVQIVIVVIGFLITHTRYS